jgi:phosphoribosyl 1,2-cyclic phosphodiesterase
MKRLSEERIISIVNNNEDFIIGQTKITPIQVNHGNLQVFGYRIQDFVYLTDVKTIDNAEIKKIIGVKVLVVNALREEPHQTHFSLQDALDFIHLVQPERAYLTHISHLMGFHEEVQQRLPKNVFLAYDNLIITLKFYEKTVISRKAAIVVYKEFLQDGFVITAFLTSSPNTINNGSILLLNVTTALATL